MAQRDPTNGSTTKFPPVQHRRLLLHNISWTLFSLPSSRPFLHSSGTRNIPAPFHCAFPNLTESFRPPRLLFGFRFPLLIF